MTLDVHFQRQTLVKYRTDVVFGWMDLLGTVTVTHKSVTHELTKTLLNSSRLWRHRWSILRCIDHERHGSNILLYHWHRICVT